MLVIEEILSINHHSTCGHIHGSLVGIGEIVPTPLVCPYGHKFTRDGYGLPLVNAYVGISPKGGSYGLSP